MRLLLLALAVLACTCVAIAQTGGGHHKHNDFSDVERSVREFEGPERAAWQKPDEVVSALMLKPGDVVADIGACTGYFSRRMAVKVAPSGKVLALDVAASLVDYMNDRARREKLVNLEARVVKPDDPGLAPASVDVVLIVDTLHHIDHREVYYPKIKKALKPGGRLVIIDFNPRSPIGPRVQERIPEAQAVAELEAAGFEVVARPAFLPYQYFLVATVR